MMETVDVLIAGEVDLPDLCALCDAIGFGHMPNQPRVDLAGIMQLATGRVWLARQGGVAVGLIAAMFEGRRGWICYFGVAESSRKSELGPELLATAEQFLKSLEARKVLLMVRNTAPALQRYCAKRGYAVDDVTVMGKWLISV